MKKYKELKFNNKIFTEQYKINDILFKEGFQWFLDCEVEDVRIEIRSNTLIFNSGTFFRGTWEYGVFRDGVWKSGVWEGGVWYNGKWFNGEFKSGIIFDGKFYHGKIESGEIKGGEFYNIIIDPKVKKDEEPQKKVQQVDNTVPQGEKITEKSMKKIMKFNDFRKINESELLGSGALIQQLEELKMSDELRSLVNQFILKYGGNKISGYDHRFSNLTFRGNLHYIIDNIKKPTLVDELQSLLKDKIKESHDDLAPMINAIGVANVMINRTFHHTEELVDLKKRTVELSTIENFISKDIKNWDDYSEFEKSKMINIIKKEFEADGFTVV